MLIVSQYLGKLFFAPGIDGDGAETDARCEIRSSL
jgi:hypothetical protein